MYLAPGLPSLPKFEIRVRNFWSGRVPTRMPRVRHNLPHFLRQTVRQSVVPVLPDLTVQKVLRHSDPKLTSEIYGHLELADVRRGLERLDFGPAALPATDAVQAAAEESPA